MLVSVVLVGSNRQPGVPRDAQDDGADPESDERVEYLDAQGIRSIASYPATTALTAMAKTTARPAHRSTRTLRRANAAARGKAVAASPKLWITSASSATTRGEREDRCLSSGGQTQNEQGEGDDLDPLPGARDGCVDQAMGVAMLMVSRICILVVALMPVRPLMGMGMDSSIVAMQIAHETPVGT